MASSSPARVNNLPAARYIAIRSLSNGNYLTLHADQGQLTFTASEKMRLATHEVVYNEGLPDDVVLIRCANGRFWRLRDSDSEIRADWESIPGASDTACHFTTVVVREGVIAFRSVRNGRYAKRYTVSSLTSGYSAVTSSLDIHCEVEVSAADDTALTLPRYLMFKGDNRHFMAVHWERSYHWQKFHKSTADLSCVYEALPLLDGSVSLRSIEVDRFCRRSPEWIWADSTSPDSDVNCRFEPLKLSSTMLALKSMANNHFLKRYTEFWVDCLCSVGTSLNDSTTHLTLSEAVMNRTLSNIRYLLDLAETSDIELVLVGQGTMRNDTPAPADLEVAVTLSQTVTESKNWSNSSTFSLGVTTTFTVGVPAVASVEGSITTSSSSTVTTELGKSIESSVQFQTVFRVPQVPPGVQARVSVQCQKAKCRVPFTYTMRHTRIDGIDLPAENRIDGIYEGANAFDILGIASYDDNHGVRTQITLPVHVTHAPLLQTLK